MKLNGEQLRQYRELAGLSREALARRAGVSPGTIKGAERGRSGHGTTVAKIAMALNIDPAALMDGVAGAPKVDVPRFLLQQVVPAHANHDIVAVFRDGAIADMRRDFDGARLRFEQALEADAGDDLDVTAQLIIRRATAMDNARQSQEALAILEPLLRESRWHAVGPQVRSWLKYHAGVAHRRIAERPDAGASSHLATAEVLLKEVETTGADSDQRIAAMHQLGCVCLVKSRQETHGQRRKAALRRAARYFNDARKKWQKKSDFREGYSLRRLADIARIEHDVRAAHAYLLDALDVFVRYDCFRYRDEVRRELDELAATWAHGATLTFASDFGDHRTDPAATLRISLDAIDDACLSVAARTARNRSRLYQAKHLGASLSTRERDPGLAAMNITLDEHYEQVRRHLQAGCDLDNRRVVAIALSDLTANPLRPHVDSSMQSEDVPLFHLADEPLGDVAYTILCCYRQQGCTRFALRHDVRVRPDGSLPDDVPADIRNGLLYWIACPPLLIDGRHDENRYAVLDYDLRHLFGYPDRFATFGHADRAAHERALSMLYATFPRWDEWTTAIRERLIASPTRETGHHAALGLSATELIIVHRVATVSELAAELSHLGAIDAVLLDSGGSCAIWANWVEGNRGGILASAWNFRPPRGAALALVLKGDRGLPSTPPRPR